MDFEESSFRDNYNPRETASIFSIITFFYNHQILKKGKKKDIEESDIYRVIPEYEAEKLGDLLESQWKQARKRHKQASILKCLLKCFGWRYFFYGLMQLAFNTLVMVITPTVFSKFVAYFQAGQTSISTKDAYNYALAIIGISLFSAFFSNNMLQLVTEYTLRVKTAICSLIFRKALRLSPVAFSEISVGKIVTLVSKDVYSIESGLSLFKDMIIGFLQLAFVSFLLYQRVGWSAMPAMAVLLLIIPLQIFVGKKIKDWRIKTAKKTDERFRLLKETLSAIKIIKMYTWQKYFEKIIHKARLQEANRLKVVYYLKAFIAAFGSSTVNLAFYVLLISYITRGYVVEAEVVYYVQSILGGIKASLGIYIPLGISQTADMMAAIQRIQMFLDAEEVDKSLSRRVRSENPEVHLKEVNVTISGKPVLNSVSLDLKKGLLLVTGNMGSGKSALLKAILGEYPISSGDLETHGTFSYASEEPWLFPSTIRQNILFGQRYFKKRYQEVLNACALTYDINKFEKLDQTIVGDKGINLSKGQQARITLARAIYRDSDIYLLDDCLSCLDNHVNKYIFNNCIKGFLKDKLCVLVTNNINNIKIVSSSSILFIENGRTLTLEQQRDALDKRITYYIDEDDDVKRLSRRDVISDNEEVAPDDSEFSEIDTLLKSNGHAKTEKKDNLYHEDKKEGKVQWSVYFRYYAFVGGAFAAIYLTTVFLVAQFCISYSDKLISMWVNLEPKITSLTRQNQTDTDEYDEAIKTREQYLNVYTFLTVGGIVLTILRSYSSFYFCMRAAIKLHTSLVKTMMSAYMYFFDDHFIGNVINRLSKDFHVIDEYLPFLVFESFRLFFAIVAIFILVASVNWILFIPAAFLVVKLFFIKKFYQPTGRSLRRIESATRSPIIGYLNSALEGLPIVRAAQQQDKLQAEFDRHQDLFTSTVYMVQSTARYFTFIIDLLGVAFTAGIVVKFIIFSEGVSAGDVGLAISQIITLSAFLQYAIKQMTEVENVMTSVERVIEYSDVTTENESGQSLENWPSKGIISYNNVSLTYESDGNSVLKNVTFEIEGQSKIGIVGRTGAGKSSIVSVLFRLYDYEGRIFIDNQNIKDLSLDYLRSNIGIIPQDPVMFCGTIRTNIDPFERFSDEEIWKVLEKVHMKTKVKSLNQPITEFTSLTYSSGQKQLICLARALIQRNKIIVLDEATAHLDPETEQLLQKSVKSHCRDCTVIAIAHRLNTVMSCDKVLVLDAGRIVEFDEPSVLLKDKGYLFRMVAENDLIQ